MRIAALAIEAMAMVSATAGHAALVISKQPSQNMTCDRGTCSATQADAVLNIKDLKKLLRGANLTISTGSAAQDIVFDAAFAWASTRQLTLSATGSITVDQPITVQGTGALTLQYSQGSPGVFLVTKRGKVDFWDLTSVFTVNSQRYYLVADIATMASYISGNSYVDLALAKDYDAQPDGAYSAAPIDAYFAGHFEGLGHTIANLTITDPTTSHHDALISNGYSAFISNVGLLNAKITAADDSIVGGLVSSGNAVFENVFVTGSLSGGQFSAVGGVAGDLAESYDCSIDHSYSAAFVTGGQYSSVGGLAGSTSGSCAVSNSHATGDATGDDAGGLVGLDEGSEIENSYATGAVHSNGIAAGGLVGQGGGIEHSFATGKVSIGDGGYAGGLVGYAGGKIYYNYATGKVVAGDNSKAGGLVGENGGDIRYSYAIGAVKAGTNSNVGSLVGNQTGQLLSYSYGIGAVTAKRGSTIGGLVGIDNQRRDIFRTYWDLDATGISDPAQGAGSPANDYGIDGLTTAQFQSGLPKGFDKSIWAEDANVNNGFPYLRSLKPR
jgi:hypothetical protein